MANKVKIDATWYYNVIANQLEFYDSTVAETGEVDGREPDVVLSRRQAHMLVDFMEDQGMLQKRLDESVRQDDLEVTHRLLDIIEDKLPEGGD